MVRVFNPDGVFLFLSYLGYTGQKAMHRWRRASLSNCDLFPDFCKEPDLDSSSYRTNWTRRLISFLDSKSMFRPRHGKCLIKTVPTDELEPLVVPLRRTIMGTGASGWTMPELNLPKGVAPTVPTTIASLTTGSSEQRENAA